MHDDWTGAIKHARTAQALSTIRLSALGRQGGYLCAHVLATAPASEGMCEESTPSAISLAAARWVAADFSLCKPSLRRSILEGVYSGVAV